MRILFLYLFPLWGNGSGSFLRELTKGLQEKGNTIAIVSPDKRKLENVTHYVVTPPTNGVFVGHPELPDAKKWGNMSSQELGEIYMSYLQTSLKAAEEFKPDLVHVFHTAFLPEIGRVIKSLYGTKYIITTHGSDLNYLEKDKRFIPLISDANKQAKFITACSDFTKKCYTKMFKDNIKTKMATVVGGVDTKNYTKDERLIKQINDKYNLHNKKVVLFTGRLTEHKGVKYLVQAAKHIDATIVIVGDGPERKYIEGEIQQHQVKNIVMTGYFNTKDPLFHALYERADVYVAPSVWAEPFGLTLLEAMAAGTPVISTNKGGVRSIIKEGVNGFMIRAKSSKQIADRVNTLLSNVSLRNKMGEAAYRTVTTKFSWDKITDRFINLYERTIQNVPTGAYKKRERIIPLSHFYPQSLSIN